MELVREMTTVKSLTRGFQNYLRKEKIIEKLDKIDLNRKRGKFQPIDIKYNSKHYVLLSTLIFVEDGTPLSQEDVLQIIYKDYGVNKNIPFVVLPSKADRNKVYILIEAQFE